MKFVSHRNRRKRADMFTIDRNDFLKIFDVRLVSIDFHSRRILQGFHPPSWLIRWQRENVSIFIFKTMSMQSIACIDLFLLLIKCQFDFPFEQCEMIINSIHRIVFVLFKIYRTINQWIEEDFLISHRQRNNSNRERIDSISDSRPSTAVKQKKEIFLLNKTIACFVFLSNEEFYLILKSYSTRLIDDRLKD